MKTERLLMIACLLCLYPVNDVHSEDQPSEWWMKPHRMIQTNLREIDATMDVDRYIRDLKEFGVNVIKFNVGGIHANYPTDLKYHYRNPFMTGDLVGTMLKRLHAEGIRMIGRFDVSRLDETVAAQHPDWLYVSEAGKHVDYNGQFMTCPSGEYQLKYMYKIFDEALDRYPLDGVFINVKGYYHEGNGMCQCDNCHRLFKEFTGMDLPPTRSDSPAYKKYADFTRMMMNKQTARVRGFLEGKRFGIMFCSDGFPAVYVDEEDVVRGEFGSARIGGTYHDTDRVKSSMLELNGRRIQYNPTANHFPGSYRLAGVAPSLHVRRVWEQLVNGAWLGFYCMGPLQLLEDRAGMDTLRDIYRLHEANEAWLLDTKPAGDVGLIRRGGEESYLHSRISKPISLTSREYQGILQILCEGQVAFELTRLDAQHLNQFPLVILPNAGGLDPEEVAVLDEYVKQGGKLLLTQQLPKGLKCLGEVKLLETRPSQQGVYLRIRPEDKTTLDMPLLDDLDIVFLRGEFHAYQTGEDVKKVLRLIPQDMIRPAEKTYYRNVSDHPALICRNYGKGAAACFTFGIGTNYEQQAHQGHAALLLGAIDNLLGLERRALVSAPTLVEINQRVDGQGQFEWISLFSHYGQRGIALHIPPPISDIRISFMPRKPVRAVHLLRADQELTFTKRDDDRITIELPPLNHYEIVVFDYQD